MDSEHEITDWSVTRWNCMEHDMYFDPDSNPEAGENLFLMIEEYMTYKQFTLHVYDYNGYLTQRARYLKNVAQLKRRRKIKRRQKRAAFRRWKRGLA